MFYLKPTTMKNKVFTFISEYTQIAIGIVLASIGLKAFLLPNGFLDGGVTGIAILINSKMNINISVLLVLLSIPFLILGYFTVSKRIVIKSIISIIGLAIFIHFENFQTITDDKLLISIFGGIFVGAGIGITIRNGSVLDGSEVLGIFLNDRWGISIGKVILVFNVILFSITAAVLSVEVALYSILTYIVTAKITDFMIEGFEDFIGLTIVSQHQAEIQKQIIHKLGIGMTIYKGEGGFGSTGRVTDLKIIHTVINRIDLRKIHQVIDDIDPEAFIIEFDINNIKGGVLRRYLQKQKHKKLPPTLLQEIENVL